MDVTMQREFSFSKLEIEWKRNYEMSGQRLRTTVFDCQTYWERWQNVEEDIFRWKEAVSLFDCVTLRKHKLVFRISFLSDMDRNQRRPHTLTTFLSNEEKISILFSNVPFESFHLLLLLLWRNCNNILKLIKPAIFPQGKLGCGRGMI